MSKEDSEKFDKIIADNSLEEYMEKNELAGQMTVKELHNGMAELAQAITIVTHFVIDFFESLNPDAEEDPPSLTADAVRHIRAAFLNAEEFNNIVCDEEDEEEEDDE